MTKLRHWFLKTLVPVALVTLVLAFVISQLLPPNPPSVIKMPPLERPLTQPISLPLAGTSSCSARGCHGAIEPSTDPARCRQNEYSEWGRDRHANAYRTLYNERSQEIARHLDGTNKAHEDPRCLACHTNPLLDRLPADNPFVFEERLFGVGCESCHGSANQWLAAHTASDWRAKKNQYAMPDLGDPAVQAKVCAGCHVGSAPSKDSPLRDVNHDMIAAGHPRLQFEFGAYQANMPSHWRAKKKSQGQLWAVGQLVSAQAALELLSHRAREGSWPEFAEYDCFACHHALTEPGWRQQAGRRRTQPGTLPWGTWYFALTRDLAGDLPELDALEKQMQTPYPDRARTTAAAVSALVELRAKRPFAGANPETLARERIVDRFRTGPLSFDPSWDAAEQLYLSYQALSPSAALHDLAKDRAFPHGFDAPLTWSRNGRQAFQPSSFLKKLKVLPR